MGIKGKTTFELTDVSTGNVEVIEDSNMLTNALQEFLASYGYFGGSGITFSGIVDKSLWVNGLGGLFLFDTNLDEDVNNTFMPAGVRMIGNGSIDVSNSGAVTELGSYNAVESGLQSDGSVKFVYDFSTQQANGTIACACLTSKVGGYMGMGNEKTSYFDEGYQLEAFTSSSICYSGIPGAEKDETHLLYPVYSENAMYLTNPYNINYSSAYASQHWSATKKIQILKVRAGFTSVGIKDNNYFKEVMASYDVDIPQSILDYMGASTNYVTPISDSINRNIYIIFNNGTDFLAAGGFCWIMKVDKNMNATAYKFTNNIGIGLMIDRRYTVFNGDYLWSYTYASSSKLFGIKYSDSTQIIDTGVSKGSQYVINNTYNIDNNLIGIYENEQTNYAPTVYDVVNRTHRQVNGYCISSDYLYLIPFADKKGIYIYLNTRTAPYQYRIMKDPRYLATINNLSEPVVKTSSKTMKVTYTLTFEE